MNIDNIFTYQTPTPEEIENMVLLRKCALSLAKLIYGMCPDGEDKKEAIKNLRTCIMYANASIVLKGKN